jgi:hypothetical protein
LLTQSDPNEPVEDAVALTPLHLAIISNQIEVAGVRKLSKTNLF